MKKIFLLIIFTILIFPVYSQVYPNVGVFPFEVLIQEIADLEAYRAGLSGAELAAVDQAISQANIANARLISELNELATLATTRVTEELNSWRLMNLFTGERAGNADYLIRGSVSRLGDQIVLTATTIQRSTGRVLNTSRQAGTAINTLMVESFCEQLASYIPIPNFLLGTWQTTINLVDGPVLCIMEFLDDRTVRVHRFDTWEHNGTNSLVYHGIGSGTYTYLGYRRRNVDLGGQQVIADATIGINLRLEDALPEYISVNISGLRVLFDDARNNFEITYGAIPFGNNFSGPSVYPGERLFYTSFTKIQSRTPYAGQTDFPLMESEIPIQAAPIWSRDLESLVLGQPYLMAESIVVATADGNASSYYMTGTELWSFEPETTVTPFLARSVEGAAYFSDSTGLFKTLNRVGNELWNEVFNEPVSFPPVVGWDGRVFIPVGSSVFTRTASGHPLWSRDLGSPMVTMPILDQAGSFVTALENRDFIRITQFSAIERIALDEIPVIITPIVSNDQHSYILFYQSGRTEKITYNESAPRGSRLSRSSFISFQALPAAAAGRGDRIALLLRDGNVQFIDGSGSLIWTDESHETTAYRRQTQSGPANLNQNNSSIVFDNRGIYIMTTNGITGFSENGRRRFMLRMEEAGSIPGFSEEGMFYTGARDNYIHAYKLDNRALNLRRSRYYGPMPEGNYGLGNPPPSPWSSDPHRWESYEQARMYDIIEEMIDSGQIGENEPIVVAYLHEMIGFFLTEGHYSRTLPRVLISQHVAFIRLLGRIGSRDTIPFLLSIFDNYHEPSVRSASAEAIGRIGVDPDGSAFVSYSFFLAPNNPNRDPQMILSASGSIADLVRFSGPPLAGDGLLLLRMFSNLTWIPLRIRNQINEEIESLYREGLNWTLQ